MKQINIGDTVMVNDQNFYEKVKATIISERKSANGKFYLLRTDYGEMWRHESTIEESAK